MTTKTYTPTGVEGGRDGLTVTVAEGDPVTIPAKVPLVVNGFKNKPENLPGWFEATRTEDEKGDMPIPIRLTVTTDDAGTVTAARFDQ